MLEAKQWVLDRIEQSFWVFIQNPLGLVMPLVLFQIVMIVLLPQIGMSVIFGWNFMQTSNVSTVLYMTMSIALIYATFYVILIIPVTISVIKWASDLIHWKNISAQTMIEYGFRKLSESFKVYWYMFAYAYLIPALCFIGAGFLVLLWLFLKVEVVSTIGWILMWISIIFWLVLWIYRWLKSTFAIWSAIYENDFSKEQFQKGISVTDNNWWRILWNFLLIWLISWLLMSLVTGFIWSITFLGTTSSWIDIESILQPWGWNIQESIEGYMNNMWGISISEIITKSISQILWSIVSAFMIVFTLIFYLRLKKESEWESILEQESFISDQL